MKDGICVKCGEREVYIDNARTHGIGVFASTFLPVNTELYVCAKCGYLEFYVESESDLAKIPQKLRKVNS
ncbi:MAG TPA: zinc ribbon domain-containing protein [Pyrinomonadaceae bacterium]|jgi:predicted nucleic-acid-binding Zn-ribbon protein